MQIIADGMNPGIGGDPEQGKASCLLRRKNPQPGLGTAPDTSSVLYWRLLSWTVSQAEAGSLPP